VRYSLAPKVFLALAIALTVSLKVMVRDTENQNAHLAVKDSVVAFLTRHRFQSHGMPDGSRIYAASGDCRLLIEEMIPQGWNLDSIKTLDTQDGRLSFVFKGMVYTDQPISIGSTTVSHYWTRLQQKLGINTVSNPVLAVVASESCSLDALPWKEIAELS
jgi:hypothetical protein